ncbi:MAG: MarR family transcriptional regulator [Candidatus Omnitrophota bacterium]|nr:MarR family transcriptional regulator [Candidatus Omnitrophota bacterium]
MSFSKNADFTVEMVKIMPVLLREVTRKHENQLTKLNLTVSHIVILDLLIEKTPCTMGEIAMSLGLTMSAVTGIIDKMIGIRLVKRERSTEDRRVVRVFLLQKGQNTVEHVRRLREDVISEMYSVLTDKERSEYLALLRKVYKNLLERK